MGTYLFVTSGAEDTVKMEKSFANFHIHHQSQYAEMENSALFGPGVNSAILKYADFKMHAEILTVRMCM